MDRETVDPVAATSAELNRRAFVGLAGAGTVAAPALLGAAHMGSTHPPLIAETDSRIAVQHVRLDRDGVDIPAYAAWPKEAGKRTPSVVVVMHVWGVDTSIRDVVRRLAVAGFAAIAPDLYARMHAPDGDGVSDVDVFRPFAKRLERSQEDGDLAAGARWLQHRFPEGKTGIIGFCMGGAIAMTAAISDAGTFSAVCPFYGPIADIDPTAIHVPFCGSYGARDTSIPADDVRAFVGKLTVPHDVRIYDEAGHAFADDQRGRYVASAAEDAWRRTLAFLKKYLT
jgi:carboxymethylenebutenolidase